MTDIKLCKDCKHYKKDWGARLTGFGDTFDLCLHPLVTENIVTGKSNGRYCDSVNEVLNSINQHLGVFEFALVSHHKS